MDKAYDLKALGEMIIVQCEQGGVQVADEAIQKLLIATYSAVKQWAGESSALSDNKIDDAIVPFLSFADQFILPLIAKIKIEPNS